MAAPRRRPLPIWVDAGLLPVVNVLLALAVAGLIVLAAGVDPLDAVRVMLVGAFGSEEAVGYTLYYATNFVFTGLAVALADRILVLCGGRVTGERAPGETNAQDLGLLMAGVSERAA